MRGSSAFSSPKPGSLDLPKICTIEITQFPNSNYEFSLTMSDEPDIEYANVYASTFNIGINSIKSYIESAIGRNLR